MRILAIVAVFVLATAIVVFPARADGPVWANGFDEHSAGFEKVLILTDAVVVRYLENGKVFVAKAESMNLARDLDEEAADFLEKKGYPEPAAKHFFIASYSDVSRKLAYEAGKPISDQNAPFHVDPDLARVEQIQLDAGSVMGLTARLASGDAEPGSAGFDEEAAKRLAGNFKCNAIMVILADGQFEDKAVRTFEPPNGDRVQRLDSPFLAVAYYEGATGKLVYFNRQSAWRKQNADVFRSALKDLHGDFPKARVGGRFPYPPAPRFDPVRHSGGDNEIGFSAPANEVMAGFESMRLGIIGSRTPAPFSGSPTINRVDTIMLSPGTKVRIIGRRSIFTKVVLSDGRVGWVPTDAVWVRAAP